MIKTTLNIDGMTQNTCETRICDLIRNSIPEAKMVSASHEKGKATFMTEDTLDAEFLKETIDTSGYVCKSVLSKYFEKEY